MSKKNTPVPQTAADIRGEILRLEDELEELAPVVARAQERLQTAASAEAIEKELEADEQLRRRVRVIRVSIQQATSRLYKQEREEARALAEEIRPTLEGKRAAFDEADAQVKAAEKWRDEVERVFKSAVGRLHGAEREMREAEGRLHAHEHDIATINQAYAKAVTGGER
jgi:chromosome segregation ATPase